MARTSKHRTTQSQAQRPFDSRQQEAYLSLWRTYDRLRAIEDEIFAHYDLTAQQYNALRLLRAKHPDPMLTSAVAEKLISRAPDITRLLDRLENRGLITRRRPADNRRVVQVGITQAGIDLLHDLTRPVRDSHAKQLGHLSLDQLDKLSELLRLVREPHEAAGSAWK